MAQESRKETILTGLRQGQKRGRHSGHRGMLLEGIRWLLELVPNVAWEVLGGASAPHQKSIRQEAGPHGSELKPPPGLGDRVAP